jgi:hypothetical protein
MIIATSGLIILGGLGGIAYGFLAYGLPPGSVILMMVGVAIVFFLELLTLCMAAMSSTGRWIAARTAGAFVPQQPQYLY